MTKFKIVLIVILVALVAIFGYLYGSGKLGQIILFENLGGKTSGWKKFTGSTAYGDQYIFSMKYPKEWVLSNDVRGGYKLTLGDCKIMAGSGGRGLEGSQTIKEEPIVVNGISGVSVTYIWPDNPNQEYTFSSFSKNNVGYIFELANPSKDRKCADDFVEIVNTFEAK